MVISIFELVIWILGYSVIIGVVMSEVWKLVYRVSNYYKPITTREANLAVARDHGRCRFDDEGGDRCKKESQHLRKIGGFNTPRNKRWVVACRQHLYQEMTRSEIEKIIAKL